MRNDVAFTLMGHNYLGDRKDLQQYEYLYLILQTKISMTLRVLAYYPHTNLTCESME